jgi:uncharacterized protein (DUF2147 family)
MIDKPALAIAAFLTALSGAPAAHAADASGTWVRPSTGTQVNFYPCGVSLCGKIVAVKDASKKSTVGTVILSGAKKIADNKWQGSLLNTEDGKTYAGHVTLEGANALKLEGCTLGGLVCKGETWTRVK